MLFNKKILKTILAVSTAVILPSMLGACAGYTPMTEAARVKLKEYNDAALKVPVKRADFLSDEEIDARFSKNSLSHIIATHAKDDPSVLETAYTLVANSNSYLQQQAVAQGLTASYSGNLGFTDHQGTNSLRRSSFMGTSLSLTLFDNGLDDWLTTREEWNVLQANSQHLERVNVYAWTVADAYLEIQRRIAQESMYKAQIVAAKAVASDIKAQHDAGVLAIIRAEDVVDAQNYIAERERRLIAATHARKDAESRFVTLTGVRFDPSIKNDLFINVSDDLEKEIAGGANNPAWVAAYAEAQAAFVNYFAVDASRSPKISIGVDNLGLIAMPGADAFTYGVLNAIKVTGDLYAPGKNAAQDRADAVHIVAAKRADKAGDYIKHAIVTSFNAKEDAVATAKSAQASAEAAAKALEGRKRDYKLIGNVTVLNVMNAIKDKDKAEEEAWNAVWAAKTADLRIAAAKNTVAEDAGLFRFESITIKDLIKKVTGKDKAEKAAAEAAKNQELPGLSR